MSTDPRSSRLHGEPHWAPRWEPPPELRDGPLPAGHLALARDHSHRTTLFPGWRETLVDRLAPHRGDTVLDIGCGTGLNFPALRARVGPEGTIIALDESPQLLTVAARRLAVRGWDNVELINAPAHSTCFAVCADAAVFGATPDVLACPAAVANVLAHLRPGAGVAAGGWKWPTRWLWPLRLCVSSLHTGAVTDPATLAQPWRRLADHIPDLQVSEVGFGTGYFAHRPTGL